MVYKRLEDKKGPKIMSGEEEVRTSAADPKTGLCEVPGVPRTERGQILVSCQGLKLPKSWSDKCSRRWALLVLDKCRSSQKFPHRTTAEAGPECWHHALRKITFLSGFQHLQLWYKVKEGNDTTPRKGFHEDSPRQCKQTWGWCADTKGIKKWWLTLLA